MSTLGLFLLPFREHQKQEDPGVGRGGVDPVSSRESESQDSIHFKLLISRVYARMTSPNLNM